MRLEILTYLAAAAGVVIDRAVFSGRAVVASISRPRAAGIASLNGALMWEYSMEWKCRAVPSLTPTTVPAGQVTSAVFMGVSLT